MVKAGKILFIAITLLLAINACKTQFEQRPALSFSVGGVISDSPEMSPYSDPQEGILSREWKGDRLIIEAFIKTYCAGAGIHGDFKVEDNKLVLLYELEIGDIVTKCSTVHKVIYEIANLPKRDYDFSIEKV